MNAYRERNALAGLRVASPEWSRGQSSQRGQRGQMQTFGLYLFTFPFPRMQISFALSEKKINENKRKMGFLRGLKKKKYNYFKCQFLIGSHLFI